MVLAPTRELAVQIKEECDKFGKSSEIKNTVVYGGVKKQTQVAALQSGVEIVIVSTFSGGSSSFLLNALSYIDFATISTIYRNRPLQDV